MGQGQAAMGCTHERADNQNGRMKGMSVGNGHAYAGESALERTVMYCGDIDGCAKLDCDRWFHGSRTLMPEAFPNGASPGYYVAGAENHQGYPAESSIPEACWLDRSILHREVAFPSGGFYETGGSSSSNSSSPAYLEANRYKSPGSPQAGTRARAALAAWNNSNASQQGSPRSMASRNSPRSQAGWELSPRTRQIAPHLKLTRECHKEKAISQLEQAIVTKNMSLLRTALESGELAGMENAELGHLRAFLQDHDNKVHARKLLAHALQVRKIDVLQDAVRRGEQVGLAATEMQAARQILAMEESQQREKEKVRSNLELAVIGRDTEKIKRAMLEFEDAGWSSNSKLLATARGLVAVGDKQSSALAALRAAVVERRPDKLRLALQEGRIAGLSPEDLHLPQTVLMEEEHKAFAHQHSGLDFLPEPPMSEEARLQKELSEAVSTRNPVELHEAIVKGIRAGLHDSVLQIPLDILQQEEAQLGSRLGNHPLGLHTPKPVSREEASPGLSQLSTSRPDISDILAKVSHSETPSDRFHSVESLRLALRDGDTVLLRASWLVHCARTQGRLPRRQDLPPEAVWDFQGLSDALESSPPIQIAATSYCWRTPEHPDPKGTLLKTLFTALEHRFTEPVGDDMAVFLDWCSLYQPPWSAEEAAAHSRGLRNVDLWYAHQRTAVWFDKTPGYDPWPYYDQRGWPWFELALGSLTTPSHLMLDLRNFSPHSSRGNGNTSEDVCHTKRIPPLLPEAFVSSMTARHVSVESDRSFLQEKYAIAFKEVMSSKWELDYQREDWGDVEVEHLSLVLPHCPAVSKVNLSTNRITDVGAKILAKTIPLCSNLRTLRLKGNSLIKKEGKRILEEAWRNAGREPERLSI